MMTDKQMDKPEIYVATDIEADGPIPGPYRMLALGMAVVGKPDLFFYSEINQSRGRP